MQDEELSRWLSEAVNRIPLLTEVLFQQVLAGKRLRYINGHANPDHIDLANVRLVASTLEQNKRLLIILPDGQPQRSPLLFAAALLTHWWEHKEKGTPPGNVVYFGSTIGIRSQLTHVKIADLQLDSVFPQSKFVARGRTGESQRRRISGPRSFATSSLPSVICVYAPADPISVLKAYQPKWIAIECGVDDTMKWLPALLDYSQASNLPIIAWVLNPMSDCVNEFRRRWDQVFHWPFESAQASGIQSRESPVCVTPIQVDAQVDAVENSLREAYYALVRASMRQTTRLGQDALQISWGLQRALEGLSVPYELYEAEAKNYWGMRRISKLQEGVERFIAEIHVSEKELKGDLEEALLHQQTVVKLLINSETPLWAALCNLCITGAPENAIRSLIFSSAARKQLFAFALLARHNISESDLGELHVQLCCMNDFKNAWHNTPNSQEVGRINLAINDPGQNVQPYSLIVGMPSGLLSRRIWPILCQGNLDVLLYPYQAGALARRIGDWNKAITVNVNECVRILGDRSHRTIGGNLPSNPDKIALETPKLISIVGEVTAGTVKPSSKFDLPDRIDEISWLIEDDESIETGHGEIGHSITGEEKDEQTQWIDDTICLHLNGGWQITFTPDDVINVISSSPTGKQVDERYVRSIRPGDNVLLIHGQRRQSLYDLIIARVHGHPTIDVHLALIRRWQEDLINAFREKRKDGWTVDEILRQLQGLGSIRISSQTVRLWLLGRTLCPEDQEDLLRLAKIMDMPFTQKYHRQVHRAAQRIRGLHRGLSIRLNHWLREQAGEIASGDASFEIFDEELGLSLQDFRDSLMILQVEAIEPISSPMLRHRLGILER